MYSFTDRDLAAELVRLARSGVRVRVYRDSRESMQENQRGSSTTATLLAGGVEVRTAQPPGRLDHGQPFRCTGKEFQNIEALLQRGQRIVPLSVAFDHMLARCWIPLRLPTRTHPASAVNSLSFVRMLSLVCLRLGGQNGSPAPHCRLMRPCSYQTVVSDFPRSSGRDVFDAALEVKG
jgi:hypothetical protein